MEKRIPHYSLPEIHAQMLTERDMNLTITALAGIRSADMSPADALSVIKKLERKNFYKSMTTHGDSSIWQDVYHSRWKGIDLYIKFQRHEEYFVISFKERNGE